ncbi:surface protein [Epilithonimonas hungarica]|uniref:BspA family leucine-rich repeat surface protein n=1 Tax=Epilithonimonas hungarica TaxID=454006 RepID=UPI00277D4B99|nr:BspA family leucine-rich repeat surface protein [Epilithonimonas hungarica]MDP9956423.1 surface protein [Epilithonimonas hungarica]
MKIKFTFLLILFCTFSFAQNEFITIWKPSNPSSYPLYNNSPYPASSNTQIYFSAAGTNYTIYWEEVGNSSNNRTLTDVTSSRYIPVLIDFGTGLSDDSQYIVKVSNGNGTFSNIESAYGDNKKLLEVKQWGNIIWTTMSLAFYGCENLDVTAIDIPNLTNVTDFLAMFYECKNLYGNKSFSLWDTSNVKNMTMMFFKAINFNQNIGSWNTSNVIDMNGMFFGVSNFNQEIGNWNTANVISMRSMFSGADVFNQNIGNWNTSKVTDMAYMFASANDFNQDIGNWDMSNVLNTSNMFSGATSFNKNIGNWDMSNIVNTSWMFYFAPNFNQNIENWNVSNVTDMSFMFWFASNFNQNLEKWNLKKVVNIGDIFRNSKLSCQNYDKTLIGWANNPNTPNNLQFTNNTGMIYSSQQSVNARNYLINTKGWTITGDSYNPNCALATNELQSKKIQIYPNPAKDFILIDNLKNNTEVEIYDIQGKLVKKEKYNNSPISLKNLSQGIYILKIPTENYSQKLIVE